MTQNQRPLRVFLCHASGDKPVIREYYKRLVAQGFEVWLDEENLLPGQDWRYEIPRVVRNADVVIVFLSSHSVTREGYVQKEIRLALQDGPYAPIRHPLYTAMLGWCLALSLLTANWIFVVVCALSVIGSLYRIPKEEQMMIESFGDEYRDYMKRTGRFFPKH